MGGPVRVPQKRVVRSDIFHFYLSSFLLTQFDNAHGSHDMEGPVVWVAGGSVAAGLKVEGSVRGKKMHVAAPRYDRVPYVRSDTSLSEVPSDQNLTETRSHRKIRNN
jgi:hypothetical protein